MNPEMEDIEFDALLKPDAWVHVCPIISNRGVTLPFELPEEAEPEVEAEDDADEGDAEEEGKKDDEKEGDEEKE